jgi:hypothetical protein
MKLPNSYTTLQPVYYLQSIYKRNYSQGPPPQDSKSNQPRSQQHNEMDKLKRKALLSKEAIFPSFKELVVVNQPAKMNNTNNMSGHVSQAKSETKLVPVSTSHSRVFKPAVLPKMPPHLSPEELQEALDYKHSYTSQRKKLPTPKEASFFSNFFYKKILRFLDSSSSG